MHGQNHIKHETSVSVLMFIQKTSESLPTTFRYSTPGGGAVFEGKTNMNKGKV